MAALVDRDQERRDGGRAAGGRGGEGELGGRSCASGLVAPSSPCSPLAAAGPCRRRAAGLGGLRPLGLRASAPASASWAGFRRCRVGAAARGRRFGRRGRVAGGGGSGGACATAPCAAIAAPTMVGRERGPDAPHQPSTPATRQPFSVSLQGQAQLAGGLQPQQRDAGRRSPCRPALPKTTFSTFASGTFWPAGSRGGSVPSAEASGRGRRGP